MKNNTSGVLLILAYGFFCGFMYTIYCEKQHVHEVRFILVLDKILWKETSSYSHGHLEYIVIIIWISCYICEPTVFLDNTWATLKTLELKTYFFPHRTYGAGKIKTIIMTYLNDQILKHFTVLPLTVLMDISMDCPSFQSNQLKW